MTQYYENLPPSGIGAATKYNFNPWYIKLRYDDDIKDNPLKNRSWVEATRPLSPVHSHIGEKFEQDIYDKLSDNVREWIDSWYGWKNMDKNEEKLVTKIKEYGENTYDESGMLTQVRLAGYIGSFYITGDADLVLLFSTQDGVQIHIIDIKSSWNEKPEHQLQTAVYTKMMRMLLDDYEFDFEFEITGGILYRETDIEDVLDRNTTPQFHVETREGDVERLLSDEGPFKEAFDKPLSELPLTVEEYASYAEVSVSEAVNQNDLSLLGLEPSEKYILDNYGLNCLNDLAQLYEPMDNPTPTQDETPEPNEQYSSVVDQIKKDPEITVDPLTISYRAQSVLGELNPESPYAHTENWLPWIPNAPESNLPDDNPPNSFDVDFERGSMVRVYLDIQHDHVRDRVVSISGVITSDKYDETIEISHVVDDITLDNSRWDQSEKQLLESAIDDIITSVKKIQVDTNRGCPVHFYIYDEKSYEKLYESVQNHTASSNIIKQFRHIMDMREGTEQKMFSFLESEIINRKAIKSLDSSITNIYEYFYTDVLDDSDFMYNGVDLREAYKQGLFDNTIPIKYAENTDEDSFAEILNKNDDTENPDNYYSLIPRSKSDIPVEYIWSCEEVSLLSKSWSESSLKDIVIDNYMWVDGRNKEKRLTLDMYSSLSLVFAKLVHHIERGLSYKNALIEKEPIDITNINIENDRLDLAIKDVLDIEYNNTRKEGYSTYKKDMSQRISGGSSLPVQITDVVKQENYMFVIKGEIILDDLGFENKQEILQSTDLKDSTNSSGSQCVATPINRVDGAYQESTRHPRQNERSVKMSIENINKSNMTIKLKGYRTGYDNEYSVNRPKWTFDPLTNNNEQYIGPGEKFILDPATDEGMFDKVLPLINNFRANPTYKDIKNGFLGNKTSAFCGEYTEYFNMISDNIEYMPNKKQTQFITNDSKYVLLQGPPGTGKTSGAISHAILSRVYNYDKQKQSLHGVVSGLSNKSIDEVLDAVHNIAYAQDNDEIFSNLNLVRVTSRVPKNKLDGVEYLNYHSEKDLEIIRNYLRDQSTLDNCTHQQTLLFVTPASFEGLIGKLLESMSTDDMYSVATDLFDLLVIDEGSMMPVYQLFMISQFMKSEHQVLLAGDHRQLPPVQSYEWEEEKRKRIIDNVPYLSALNYFRLLRGENIDRVPDKHDRSNKADIPIVRLEKTYRCHKRTTDLLQNTVYFKDDVNYSSEITSLIRQSKVSEEYRELVQPEYPITLILYDDTSSRRVNIIEQQIIKTVLSNIDDTYSTGIVTPHNAQKGKLSLTCPQADVDTVERFQGGEKDIITVSATVNDTKFLSKEEEFILSENRLNVALSRMKKKLIVVASKSIFEFIPSDIDTYDQARLWKSLYSKSNAFEEPAYTTNLNQLTDMDYDKTVEVYNISEK